MTSNGAAPLPLQHSYSTSMTTASRQPISSVHLHQSQYALDCDDDGDEEDEEEERRFRNQARGVTPEGYYEDFYKQYAFMDGPAELPHDSATPYASVTRAGNGGGTTSTRGGGVKTRDVQNLNRNKSTSNQTEKTTTTSTLSRLGSMFSKGRATSESARSRHTRGNGSSTLPLSSPASRTFGWIPSFWPARLFLLATIAESAADISIEAVLLSRFREQQGGLSVGTGQLSALPVFLIVFGMAHVYQCFLAFDAVVNRNTILVFGLVAFNLAFLVYALIQIEEIRGVLGNGVIPGTSQTVPVQVLTGAIPVIIGVTTLVLGILAFLLWKEFGWEIYKTIGADRRLKKAHLHFQVFVCLLKFDFFTFIAYCVQLVLVVLSRTNVEFWITTFSAPVTLILLVFAWYSVRKELKWGVCVFLVGLVGGIGYFSYKLFRIWQGRDGPYKEVYKSLTVFSILALALGLATIVSTLRCLVNFNIGLKTAMTRSQQQRAELREDEMGPVISAPFQYNPDSPYAAHNAEHGAPRQAMLADGPGSPDLAVSPGFGYDPYRQDSRGYFDSSPSYGQITPSMPHMASSHRLLSPTGGNHMMPLKTSSTLNLERGNSNANHRLSLD